MFSLRDVGVMLLGLPATATPARIATAMHKNCGAAANYARLRVMLERVGEGGDAVSLFRPSASSGSYAVADWIDRGALPDGSTDPSYAIASDATRKNHYNTLVLLSTPGKRCDALATLVSPEARAFFKARLASLSARKQDGGGAGEGEQTAAWEEILAAYADPDRLSRLNAEDRLIVDFWVLLPPATRQDFSNVVVVRSSRSQQPLPGQVALHFRGDSAFIETGASSRIDICPELSKSIKNYMEARGWRRWLFQSRSGKPRPLKPNTFGQQVQAAFHRLMDKRVGVNALVRAYSLRQQQTPEPPRQTPEPPRQTPVQTSVDTCSQNT
jgi:hypothetical protein